MSIPSENKNDQNENDYLKRIRFYRGDWKDFEQYWKDRGISLSPYNDVNYEYPKKKTEKDESTPRQTYGLQPKQVKESRTFLRFNEFVLLKTGDHDKFRRKLNL